MQVLRPHCLSFHNEMFYLLTFEMSVKCFHKLHVQGGLIKKIPPRLPVYHTKKLYCCVICLRTNSKVMDLL